MIIIAIIEIANTMFLRIVLHILICKAFIAILLSMYYYKYLNNYMPSLISSEIKTKQLETTLQEPY